MIVIPRQFKHQKLTTELGLSISRVLDFSDPGTGKTRAWIDVISARKKELGGKALVVAPKSILGPAWGDDVKRFAPHLRYSIARAENRLEAFERDADIYITNHDAVKWLLENENLLKDFHTLIIDESTAFKHRTSQRSKAIRKLVKNFEYRAALTGTPSPNGLLDLWHQVLLIDDGSHLGNSFWRYRGTVCAPKQIGPSPMHLQWDDKPGAAEAIADLLEDITIRHVFEECVDIPSNTTFTVPFHMSAKQQEVYNLLRDHAVLELKSGSLDTFAALTLATKLLQTASGAVYGSSGDAVVVDTARHELVMELAAQRKHSVVVFNWKHQRDQMVKIAKSRGISYRVIDGDNNRWRDQDIRAFQAGMIQVLFCHPQSAAHGLTLTRGTTTIWSSPTYNAEHFQQLNRRIYRAGQTRKTETILVAAENTVDQKVYDKLQGKLDVMQDLLSMLEE